MSNMQNRGPQSSFPYFFIIALILGGLFWIPATSALTVSGSKYMETLPPGAVDSHMITVGIDGTGVTTDVALEVMGFANSPDGSYTPLTAAEDTGPFSARTFITLDKNKVHLVPGTQETINATITVPQDATSGGRYAIIYIQSLPEEKGSVGIITAIAVPILITISGSQPIETGKISDLSVGKIVSGQPFTISTAVQNTGNHHYYHLTDTVEISGANGDIARGSVGPVAYAVIPGNTVQFKVPVDSPLTVGTYTVKSTVTKENGTILDQKSANFEVTNPFSPPPKPASITLAPQTEGNLVSPDGRYEVIFPAGSVVVGNVVVTLSPVPPENIPPSAGKMMLGTSCFVVTGIPGLLAKPATLKVKYSDADLRVANGDATLLNLARFDEGGNEWVVIPTTKDSGTLVGQSDRMGTWAVVAGGTTPNVQVSETGFPLVWTIGAGIVVIVVLAALFIISRMRKQAK